MTDATFVDVFDARYDLLENPDCRLLVKTLVLYDVVEQFSAAAVLHDQVQFRFSFNYLTVVRKLSQDLPRIAVRRLDGALF